MSRMRIERIMSAWPFVAAERKMWEVVGGVRSGPRLVINHRMKLGFIIAIRGMGSSRR